MATSKSSHRPPNKRIGNSQPTNLLRVVSHFSSGIVERAKRERAWKSPHECKGVSPRRVSPFLACGEFHARSRFARSTIPEEKWGTTRSLACYFHHLLIIGAIRNIVGGGGVGGERWGWGLETVRRGGSRGRVQGVRTPPLPEMTCGFLIQLVFCKKKNYVVYWCWSRERDECTPS